MSVSKLEPVLAHIDANIEIATAHLFDLLRIPSISTDPNFKVDCDKAADWLVQDLKSIGFDASKRITPGHPMVLAHAGDAGTH